MNRNNARGTIVFLCCLMAMPTCAKLLPGFYMDNLTAGIVAGALLGTVHLVLRPLIRLAAAPIGCLTMGLIQPVIDMGLIYMCDRFVGGFSVGDPIQVLLAVILINVITFIAAGRK